MKKIIKFLVSKINTDILRSELHKRDIGTVKGSVFDWMRTWLNAYSNSNNDLDVKKVMDWIFNQPMSGS